MTIGPYTKVLPYIFTGKQDSEQSHNVQSSVFYVCAFSFINPP